MLELERIFKQDRLLRAMTGLTRQGFEALLPTFALEYEQSLKIRSESRQRGFE